MANLLDQDEPALTPPRLLKRPAFVLSTVRSGSTLLRCLLNSHTQICAPSEIHLASVKVSLDQRFGEPAMKAQRLDGRQLEHMLWDRLLAYILVTSGKEFLVEKTPSNVKIAGRLAECWPDARFLLLRRNPAAIVASIVANGHSKARAITVVREAADRLDCAAASLPGAYGLSYEDLTTAPSETMKRVCAFLGVDFEPEMLSYGTFDHGPMNYGIGDWTERIRSGRIHLPRDVGEPVEEELRQLSHRWGYLSLGVTSQSSHDRPGATT